jgi:hypothetical protein
VTVPPRSASNHVVMRSKSWASPSFIHPLRQPGCAQDLVNAVDSIDQRR